MDFFTLEEGQSKFLVLEIRRFFAGQKLLKKNWHSESILNQYSVNLLVSDFFHASKIKLFSHV